MKKLRIGDDYGGGKIVYIDTTGKHGLIVAKEDLPEHYNLAEARKACSDLVIDGYTGWKVPTIRRLKKIYPEMELIGGFEGWDYWSSTKSNKEKNLYWYLNFGDGPMMCAFAQRPTEKLRVRPVRTF